MLKIYSSINVKMNISIIKDNSVQSNKSNRRALILKTLKLAVAKYRDPSYVQRQAGVNKAIVP